VSEDFDDLEDLVGDALLHRQRAKEKPRAAKPRTQDSFDFDPDLDSLLNEALDKREWIPLQNVVLVHVQQCSNCHSTERWTDGWFTTFKHRSDPFATRMTKGRTGGLPLGTSEQLARPVDICSSCCATQIAIEVAFAPPEVPNRKDP
jgi:hypothetical protein